MSAVASYDFERFAILVVEDNGFMRHLMTSVLKNLGFGRVDAASHGGEAIDFLRAIGKSPSRGGLMSIDMIVSNWQMEPIDGLELLRWVRRAKDSPDRCVPFVMVTAFADMPRLRQARDAGVTEFMVKPYSIATLCNRVLAVIERPRQFVSSPKFFGPDRRRRARSRGHRAPGSEGQGRRRRLRPELTR